MKIELVPRDLLDNIIKDRCETIPPSKMRFPLNQNDYEKETDVFYRNFGKMNQREYSGENKENEVNGDIEAVDRRSKEEIFKIREGRIRKWEEKNKDKVRKETKEEKETRNKGKYSRCTLMICDNRCFFDEDLDEYFKDFTTKSFAKLKKYDKIPLVERIGIQMTCADTRYKPLIMGYIITD